MANISVKNLAKAFYEASKDKDEANSSMILENFLNLLKRKHLIRKTDGIIKELEKIIDDENKTKKIKISSRNKLSEKHKKEIEDFLKEKYKIDKIKLETYEDEKLLGGVKIEIDDEIIDTTIKNKLSKLQNYLINN